MFRDQVAQALNEAQFDVEVREKLSWLRDSEAYVNDFVLFRTARNMYLRGEFESNRVLKTRSALSYYFAFMYSDDEIAEVETNSDLQSQLGIRKGANQSVMDWQRQLALMKQNMRLIRADAAFFLALAHFESGNPQPALNWLERMPEIDDEQRWEPWRPYQMGRAWEASGEYQKAAESYLEDQSAQRHGSLLRARWMTELAEHNANSRP
jgi:hypothetical protein